MPTRILLPLATVAVVLLMASRVPSSGAQESPRAAPQDPGEAVKSLQRRLNDVAEENAALKQRVKELEAQVRKLKENRITTRVVPAPRVPPQAPPDWKVVPFNQGYYYLVPLAPEEGGPGGPAGTAKALPPAAPAK